MNHGTVYRKLAIKRDHYKLLSKPGHAARLRL